MIALMARHITGKRKDINKMYSFVEEKSENTPILNYDILEIENKYNIIFPTILKEYYLMHNGDKIKLCIFTVDEEEFGVAKIVELKYGNCSFEKIVNNDREDGFIDEHLYEFCMDNRMYSDYSYQSDPEGSEPSTRVKLDQLGLMKKQKFSLHYDFGDDWMFTITVQDITETAENTAPNVIKAKGSIEQYPYWDEEEYDYE